MKSLHGNLIWEDVPLGTEKVSVPGILCVCVCLCIECSVSIYVCVLVECIHEAKVASLKPRTELRHSILDSTDIVRVGFKFPFSDSFKLSGYKGS